MHMVHATLAKKSIHVQHLVLVLIWIHPSVHTWWKCYFILWLECTVDSSMYKCCRINNNKYSHNNDRHTAHMALICEAQERVWYKLLPQFHHLGKLLSLSWWWRRWFWWRRRDNRERLRQWFLSYPHSL
jgi:hypothetical protein